MLPWGRFGLLSMISRIEDVLVALILRSPKFHHGVGKIHRTVQQMRHGRNPNEPLHQGEATANPHKTSNFFKLFIDELRNQARGRPTNPPPMPPKK